MLRRIFEELLCAPTLNRCSLMLGVVAGLCGCSTFRTVEFDPAADLRTELARAISIVEKSVPVPHPEKYSVVMAALPEGTIAQYDSATNIVRLNSALVWAVWEKTADLETRMTFDPASAIAREIACNDPELPLQHHPLGWLTGPLYQVVRRINRFDLVEDNGCPLCEEVMQSALVEVSKTEEGQALGMP